MFLGFLRDASPLEWRTSLEGLNDLNGTTSSSRMWGDMPIGEEAHARNTSERKGVRSGLLSRGEAR